MGGEIRAFFSRLFAQIGIACDAVTSAEEADEMLGSEHPYSICFIDWRLQCIFRSASGCSEPKTSNGAQDDVFGSEYVNGIEFARRLKNRAADTSVVLLSSAADRSAAEDACAAAGMGRMLSKPLFPSDVAARGRI